LHKIKLLEKLIAHKHLFTSQQLEGMYLVVNNIEEISKANGECERVRSNREQANQDFDQYCKEISGTKTKIREQEKKMEKSTSRRKIISKVIVRLENRIKSLKEERSNIDSNQNLKKKYLKAVYLML
jgi:septal ring factor EnvC (AmiA/AmiB activator)